MVLMPEEVYKESIYFVSSTFEDSLLTKKKKSEGRQRKIPHGVLRSRISMVFTSEMISS
jgi:hypothetical protein